MQQALPFLDSNEGCHGVIALLIIAMVCPGSAPALMHLMFTHSMLEGFLISKS
jgi:hypothetical protein